MTAQHDAVRTLILQLDALLTGKPQADIQRNALAQQGYFDDLFGSLAGRREYYLADGGYSRIVITEEAEIWLTSNSRVEIKQRWFALSEALVSELKTAVGAAIADAG